jgi:Resolvase, N terminal domain
VVYKVDRLTRFLADFTKLVELFDAHGVSFVSVTQQFNTTTSMGRLTLNVLLSFAQFEREVTSERIRDKIGASKRRGLWVGGMVPLGYVSRDKKLVIEEDGIPDQLPSQTSAAQRQLMKQRVLVLRGVRVAATSEEMAAHLAPLVDGITTCELAIGRARNPRGAALSAALRTAPALMSSLRVRISKVPYGKIEAR